MDAIGQRTPDNPRVQIMGRIWKSGYGSCETEVLRSLRSAKTPIAKESLDRIAALYAIEKQIRGRPPDERRQIRQQRAQPKLDALQVWLKDCAAKFRASRMSPLRFTM